MRSREHGWTLRNEFPDGFTHTYPANFNSQTCSAATAITDGTGVMTGRLLSIQHRTCSSREEVFNVVTQTWSQNYGCPGNREGANQTTGWQGNAQGRGCGWGRGPSGPAMALDHGN
jgi:hypothetical protein